LEKGNPPGGLMSKGFFGRRLATGSADSKKERGNWEKNLGKNRGDKKDDKRSAAG